MTAVNFSLLLKAFSSLPQLSSRRALSRDSHGLAERVLDAVEEHLNLVADLEVGLAAGPLNSRSATAPFGLEATVDDGHVFFDRDNNALDDGAFLQIAACEGFIEHRGKSSREGL